MEKQALGILIGMHRMMNSIDKKTSHLAAAYQLTLPQFAVLEALLHKGPMTVGEVQEAILSSCGTISVIVRNLEKRELIERKTDPEDRRKFQLSLTEEGRRVIETLYPENEAMILEEFSIYSAEEQKELLRLLGRHRRNTKP